MRETLLQVVKIAVSVVVPLASLATGLQASEADPKWLIKRPSLLLRSLLSVLVLVPVGTLAFLEAIGAPTLIEAGLLITILAVGIGPMASFKRARAAEVIDYEVELNVVLLMLAIVFIPTAAAVLGAYFQRAVSIAPGRVAELVLTRALAPLLFGVVIARLLPKAAKPLARIAGPLVQLVLLVVVLVAVAATWRGMLALGARGWIICAALAAGAMAIGHLCGGPDPAHRRVLATYSSTRFPGLALLIASFVPAGKKVVPTVLAYVISTAVCLAIYDALGARRRRRAEAAAIPKPALGRS